MKREKLAPSGSLFLAPCVKRKARSAAGDSLTQAGRTGRVSPVPGGRGCLARVIRTVAPRRPAAAARPVALRDSGRLVQAAAAGAQILNCPAGAQILNCASAAPRRSLQRSHRAGPLQRTHRAGPVRAGPDRAGPNRDARCDLNECHNPAARPARRGSVSCLRRCRRRRRWPAAFRRPACRRLQRLRF